MDRLINSLRSAVDNGNGQISQTRVNIIQNIINKLNKLQSDSLTIIDNDIRKRFLEVSETSGFTPVVPKPTETYEEFMRNEIAFIKKTAPGIGTLTAIERADSHWSPIFPIKPLLKIPYSLDNRNITFENHMTQMWINYGFNMDAARKLTELEIGHLKRLGETN